MSNVIVVVEDDKDINDVVCEYLREEKYSVVSFSNGKEAYEYIIKNKNISLLILDIMLPEMSGLELLKKTRMNEIHKAIPIVMLTALNDEDTQIESFDYLADDYVTKPFSPKVLIKRVNAILRRSGESLDKIQISNIIIELERYEAFQDNEKIDLTYKEFELLKLFAKNPNKVFPRQTILNLIWEYDFYGDERIIDVHIKNLRKKLNYDLIKTVKGVGYKFEEPSLWKKELLKELLFLQPCL